MREDYEDNCCDFEVLNSKGEVIVYEQEAACFAEIPDSPQDYQTIKIFDILCEPTETYAEDYIEFINEIHPIKWGGRDIVSFETTGNRAKDLAICCMVRMLWEKNNINLDLFFNTLLYDLIEKDPIKRFIKAYNTNGIIGRYSGVGHAFGYTLKYKLALKNKSLKSFKTAIDIHNHYDFFTNTETKRVYSQDIY